jgi:hypothetical protein
MRPEEVLIPITMFLATGATIIIWLITRHRERITMIEKGLSVEQMKSLTQRDPQREIRRDPLGSLKWGIIFVLGGLAIMIGNYLHMQFNTDESVTFGLITLFVGIGLITFYSIASKKLSQPPQV